MRDRLSIRLRVARGVTLLELLIAMLIMMMVTAAAIPLVQPALQNRRMREAARLVSSYFSGARARAIETGRPVGVMIERFNGQAFSMNLSYVEVPAPYAGDFAGSTIVVSAGMVNSATPFPLGDIGWQNNVRFGDFIKLDYKGPQYLISSSASITAAAPDQNSGQPVQAPSSQTWYLLVPNPSAVGAYGPPSNPPNYTGVAFQIFRQPVRSSAAPLQLPEGAAIDLAASGMGASGYLSFISGSGPFLDLPPNPATSAVQVLFNPVITFMPGGSVGYVSGQFFPGGAGYTRATGPIFLLLGRREFMPDASKTGFDENLYDPAALAGTAGVTNQYLQNFWIVVGPQTGLVTTSEAATNPQPGNSYPTPADSRTIAIQAQSIGGR